ncbi:MAG: hypothetical protein U0169_17695 [Polyangiaceae bacterium]
MRPHVSRPKSVLVPWASVALLLGGCNVLTGRDGPVVIPEGDAGGILPGVDGGLPTGTDASVGVDAASGVDATAPVGDGAVAEAGPRAPDDFDCDGTWADLTHVDPRCNQRKIFVVKEDVIDADFVSIATNGSGTVAIAFDAYNGADQAEFVLRTFPTSAMPTAATGATARVDGPFGTVYGVHGSVKARTGADSFAVAYLSVHDGSAIWRKYDVGSGFSPEEKVGSGATAASFTSMAVNGTNDAHVVYFNATSGKLVARTRTDTTGVWSAPTTPGSSYVDRTAPDVGRNEIVLDPTGTPIVGYVASRFDEESTVQCTELQGALWGNVRTLAQNMATGFAGHSLGFAVGPDLRHAVYYVDIPTRPQAALVYTTHAGISDIPSESVIDGVVERYDGRLVEGAAIAVDGYGLVHIVYSHVSSTGSSLTYRRQVQRGNSTVWLEDQIVHDVFSRDYRVKVALTVDAKGRPFIAFVNEKDLTVRYATRFDR